jgi:hypothetical protein
MTDAVDFKVALDQYNKQIAFLRDQSQKACVVLLTFLAFYHSLATPESSATLQRAHSLLTFQNGSIIISVLPVILFSVLQMTNFIRCQRSYLLLGLLPR